MITQDKITDIFCVLDEFSKKFDAEAAKGELISSTGGRHRRPRAARRRTSEGCYTTYGKSCYLDINV